MISAVFSNNDYTTCVKRTILSRRAPSAGHFCSVGFLFKAYKTNVKLTILSRGEPSVGDAFQDCPLSVRGFVVSKTVYCPRKTHDFQDGATLRKTHGRPRDVTGCHGSVPRRPLTKSKP